MGEAMLIKLSHPLHYLMEPLCKSRSAHKSNIEDAALDVSLTDMEGELLSEACISIGDCWHDYRN